MDELLTELTELTCDLIRFPSTAEHPEALRGTIDYVARYLADCGLHLERSESEGKPALVATTRATRRPQVMFNGHLDVVAAEPHQFNPEVRDGRIYGRGSQDMKGSVAVMMRLARDLAALPEPPDVGFQFVSDEEIGGRRGTGRLVAEGWECETLLCLEPTDMGICYAHKGAMWLELALPGNPAHGSRPWDGLNPTLALVAGLQQIEARYPTLREETWRTTITPTRITVGDGGSRNQIPGGAEVTFDIRYVPEDRADEIQALVRDAFPTAQFAVAVCSDGLFTNPEEPAVLKLADLLTTRLGHEPRFFREHFATDARYYSHIGTPAVCVGPVGAGLHSREEWVSIASLGDLYGLLREYVTA